MFDDGDIIDGKYRVDGLCSDSGGMGAILFVSPTSAAPTDSRIVLKYCRETDDEYLRRFRREVRLLNEFAGNSRVVQILDQNLDYEPPYFVMPFYADGDLMTIGDQLQNDHTLQETVFLQMIDCIAELHAQAKYHRDIKPENFLRDGSGLRVSDLGLSMELNSPTAFTRSSQYWGTPGYLPPEFEDGGFRHADAAGDVFMLGKSFYALLTGRNPTYLIGNQIPDALFHLIQKCCNVEKGRRYQSLAALKQSVVAVFDVILNRVDGRSGASQLFEAISTRLSEQNQFDETEVNAFLDALVRLDQSQLGILLPEIHSEFYRVMTIPPIASRCGEFLGRYRLLVEGHDYSWAYAEVIANNMQILFDADDVDNADRAVALELAMDAATAMNRFAAMETCQQMIKSVDDDQLALLVRDVLVANPERYVYSIEPVNCRHETISTVIQELKREHEGAG